MAIDGKDVDILFHAAVVHEALNDRPRARAELDAAVKLGPETSPSEPTSRRCGLGCDDNLWTD